MVTLQLQWKSFDYNEIFRTEIEIFQINFETFYASQHDISNLKNFLT